MLTSKLMRNVLFTLLLGVCGIAQGNGFDCERPAISGSVGAPTAFSFTCINNTGAEFQTFDVFPLCKNSNCTANTVTATGCSGPIPKGGICEVKGQFNPPATGTYDIDFDVKYGGVSYKNIFCATNKGCIIGEAFLLNAYVASGAGNGITVCGIDPDTGEFINCPEFLDGPFGIATTIINGTTYAYIANVNNSTITLCTIDNVGKLKACVDSQADLGIFSPSAIGINGGYVYVGNFNGDIDYCAINPSNGLLDAGCEPTSASIGNSINGITFLTINYANVSTTYAYITSGDNEIYLCTVVGNDLSGCTETASTFTFSDPQGITIQAIPMDATYGFAYISNSGHNDIAVCVINAADGTLGSVSSPCVSAGEGGQSNFFDNPIGITTLLSANGYYVYITNANNDEVALCSVNITNTTGTFDTCNNLNGTNLDYPNSIAVQTIGATTYAYVGNLVSNFVTQCLIGSGGIFHSCSSPSPFFEGPVAIEFLTFEENQTLRAYAYIVTGNGITACEVNNFGELYSCFIAADASYFIAPSNITFAETADGIIHAYIVNSHLGATPTNSGSVTVCAVDRASKKLNNCRDSGAYMTNFDIPLGIAIHNVGFERYAYITNSLFFQSSPPVAGNVVKCLINEKTGDLYPICSDSGAGSFFANSPRDIVFKKFANETLAYVLNSYSADSYEFGNVTYCKVDAFGGFNTCQDSGAGEIFFSPQGMAFLTINNLTYAYVANSDSTITKCTVKTSGSNLGQFESATCGTLKAGPTFAGPAGLTFY